MKLPEQNPRIYLRRLAHLALDQAFTNAGIPSDLVVLPLADDIDQLDVRNDYLVVWSDRGITVDFDALPEGSVPTGWVSGSDAHNIVSDPMKFDPEDFGISPVGCDYPFRLRFDLNDVSPELLAAMRDTPFKQLKKRSARPLPIGSHAKRALT
jgi:hypothetical protein